MEAAVQILKQNHYRVTKQRMSMLDYLKNHSHHFIAATQVDAYLRTLYPSMSHNTIYRNIREFAQLGIVETKERNNATWVKYQCDFKNRHHHHFVCRCCGAVSELKMCPLRFFEDQLPGYVIETHNIELSGLCNKCASKQKN